jgi:hypothetical protein
MTKRDNKSRKLETLRLQIKAGLDALQRGEFTEIADVDLERYLNDLVSARRTRSSPAKSDADNR